MGKVCFDATSRQRLASSTGASFDPKQTLSPCESGGFEEPPLFKLSVAMAHHDDLLRRIYPKLARLRSKDGQRTRFRDDLNGQEVEHGVHDTTFPLGCRGK